MFWPFLLYSAGHNLGIVCHIIPHTLLPLLFCLSAIIEHKLNTGHQCSMKNVKILDHEENWHRKKIKEAINVHREKNRDIGQELPPVLLQLVSHDIGHVTHP